MPGPQAGGKITGPTKSSLGDMVFALGSLFLTAATLSRGFACAAGSWGRVVAIGYAVLNVFLIIRLHLQVLWLGGFDGFCHISKRFPAAWINTMVYFPLFVASKLLQFLVCEVLYLDYIGWVFKCKGQNLTLERYARMARDLNKPLIFRKSGTYWNFTIYPFMVSTGLMTNIYTLGPYMGFGVLPLLFDKNHVTIRNGLFGTHPAYNHQVSCFFDNDKGEAHWHVSAALLPMVGLEVYRITWNFYAEHMIDNIEESEQRAGSRITAPSTDMDTTWVPETSSLLCRAPRAEKKHLIESTVVVSESEMADPLLSGP